MRKSRRKVALVGNPNSGKTSLFNTLTGLKQKVGNYPGVTVDKRSGVFSLPSGEKIELVDLPGTYSLSSTNEDEKVVQNILLNPKNVDFPDLIVFVADGTNLSRNLFFASQIIELNIPVVLAINMMDIATEQGKRIDIKKISDYFDVPVAGISARKGSGISDLIEEIDKGGKTSQKALFNQGEHQQILDETKGYLTFESAYMQFKQFNNLEAFADVTSRDKIEKIFEERGYEPIKSELLEINNRAELINEVAKDFISETKPEQINRTERIDRYVTHPFWGLIIFLSVFFVLFQAIFSFASYPMDAINDGVVWMGEYIANLLPDGIFTDFVADGIFGGLAGVLVFVPQIMILFGLIALLEDTGYLSRVSFMTDGLLRRFGMNGKSIVPLVGGFACAIPAIMAARTIENRKERLITIFITPLMSCSARLPVYVFLVSFIAPREFIWGVISVQGLFMMGLYLLGIIVSLLIAWLINKFSKVKGNNSFILELPNYKTPSLKNALSQMINKGRIFVVDAGKVIIIASMILWVLSYFGPSEKINSIEKEYAVLMEKQGADIEQLEAEMNAEKLEHSYLGVIGKTIEPVIQPLGYDWKIGVAVVASFAAREVFVGTMSTIYSVKGDIEGNKGLKSIKFSYATAFSLLLFYVFALQCMSTIAIVRQETGKWSVAIWQFVIFTGIAYLSALATYQILS